MKTKIFYLLIIILPGIAQGQINNGFDLGYETDSIQEDYLTIVITGFTGLFTSTQKAYISINGEKFETISVSKTENYNFNEAIKIMKKYNEKGWILKNSNLLFNKEGSDYLYILMTRRKNNNKEKSD